MEMHYSVHAPELVKYNKRIVSRNTNKMQLCNRIYYSIVFFKGSTCFERHTAHHQEL